MTSPGSDQLAARVAQLAKARVGVVGDFVADVYISGRTERLSREAPVPVVRFEGERLVPGCGANVAVNIASIGAAVGVVGLVGDDKPGRDLAEALGDQGVNVEGLIKDSQRSTTTKTRLLAGARHTIRQQLVRLDREPTTPPSPRMRQALLDGVRRLDDEVDAWIISDYGYHGFDDALKAAMREIASRKCVLADSRFDTLGFRGVTVIKPNEDEAIEATSIRNGSVEEMKLAAAELSDRLDVPAVLITLGNQGMLLYERGRGTNHIPAVGTDEIVDLTGAGDTVAAVFTTSMAAGMSPLEAARLSNCAASVVVMKEGAATARPEELVEAVLSIEA
ncbi:MAG: bifunctional hydroxymethylpyrimidine kinase/phosphomethylpyrimidine kinase [Phycisphaerae bacterium]|nr:bifunctional hydroxymethylpyrimidine kinase/phosphomethylpyrimidine kinase [Phycisphaerae bacterium]